MGDPGLIPGSGRSPGEGNGNPLQYSCLENPHGQRNLVGYSPRGCKESDTTEWLHFFFHFFWLWEVLWSFFSVQLLSWLSYKVDFMLHVVIWSRSGSVLLRRVKEDSTSKQFFLFWGSSQGTHLLRFFIFPVYFKCWTTLEWITLSSLETSHVVIRGSASVMLSVGLCQLPVAIHCTPHLQSSRLLCKKLEPPLHGRFISSPGSNVLLMLWDRKSVV